MVRRRIEVSFVLDGSFLAGSPPFWFSLERDFVISGWSFSTSSRASSRRFRICERVSSAAGEWVRSRQFTVLSLLCELSSDSLLDMIQKIRVWRRVWLEGRDKDGSIRQHPSQLYTAFNQKRRSHRHLTPGIRLCIGSTFRVVVNHYH